MLRGLTKSFCLPEIKCHSDGEFTKGFLYLNDIFALWRSFKVCYDRVLKIKADNKSLLIE